MLDISCANWLILNFSKRIVILERALPGNSIFKFKKKFKMTKFANN